MLKKYIVDLLQDNPLNGINANNDVLTLSTGAIIRKIKKLVFDGTENWRQSANGAMYLSPFTGESYKKEVAITSMNSHFDAQINTTSGTNQVRDNSSCFLATSGSAEYYIGARSYVTAADFKAYLAQQYSAGTPVTVWYILETETTEYITIPTGLSGTVDGYTTQTGTPTPTTPIYPTANTVTMWANYTPQRYNGNAFVTATGQPEQYNGGWT